MIIEKDLGARKATMLARADGIAVLVGGIGTLDEVMSVLELKKHRVHTKPVVVLNSENFYDGLKSQLEKMDAEGFLPASLSDLLYFAQTPADALNHLEQ
jgi:predicted Rossmann-fold nucleotide-binding protein